MSLLQVFALALPLIVVMMALLWLVSLRLRDASIVDIFWGIGFIAVSIFSFAVTGGTTIRRPLVLALVALWGVRLAGHIFQRNQGKGEDPRYRAWRDQAGTDFWWISYFKVFLLQGGVMWIVSLPLLVAIAATTPGHLTLLDIAGLLLWIGGFLFEAIADWQLARFKRDPANKGKVLQSGLWAYTRHPNYFGESLIWWGFFCLAAATPSGYVTVLSPLLMTWLLLRVSGVAMLERNLRREKPQYEAYIRKTNAFFPGRPRS